MLKELEIKDTWQEELAGIVKNKSFNFGKIESMANEIGEELTKLFKDKGLKGKVEYSPHWISINDQYAIRIEIIDNTELKIECMRGYRLNEQCIMKVSIERGYTVIRYQDEIIGKYDKFDIEVMRKLIGYGLIEVWNR